MPITETNRLSIRELEPGDATFVFEIVNSPGWLAFIGDRGVKDLESAGTYINRNINNYKTLGFGLYALALKDCGKLIGMCGLLKRDYLSAGDLGYALLPQYEGKGFAREAAAAVMNFAQDTLKWPELFAIVTPKNKRSILLLDNLGFEFEKEMKEAGEELLLYSHRFKTANLS